MKYYTTPLIVSRKPKCIRTICILNIYTTRILNYKIISKYCFSSEPHKQNRTAGEVHSSSHTTVTHEMIALESATLWAEVFWLTCNMSLRRWRTWRHSRGSSMPCTAPAVLKINTTMLCATANTSSSFEFNKGNCGPYSVYLRPLLCKEPLIQTCHPAHPNRKERLQRGSRMTISEIHQKGLQMFQVYTHTIHTKLGSGCIKVFILLFKVKF